MTSSSEERNAGWSCSARAPLVAQDWALTGTTSPALAGGGEDAEPVECCSKQVSAWLKMFVHGYSQSPSWTGRLVGV